MSDIDSMVRIRPMRDSDLNFVRSSWLKSYRRTVPDVLNDVYFRLHWEVAMGLLDRPGVRSLVACSSADDDQLIGWACGEPGAGGKGRALAHYCYVKHTFRGMGIARQLVSEVLSGGTSRDVTATHVPLEDMRKRLEGMGWIFRPQFAFYLAMERDPEAA